MKSGGDDAIDSKAMSPVLTGPGDADAARMSFTLDGRAFIAVPASQWTASQYRSSNGARLHVVGYVRLAGSAPRSDGAGYCGGGRPRDMGIGPVHVLTLAEAREKAREASKLRLEGIDPIAAKHAQRAAAVVAATSR
jgi:Arm DNA-binding domain